MTTILTIASLTGSNELRLAIFVAMLGSLMGCSSIDKEVARRSRLVDASVGLKDPQEYTAKDVETVKGLALNGNYMASYFLHQYYRRSGKNEDAVIWLERSVKQGSPVAQVSYSSYLERSNDPEAQRIGERWLNHAAASGYSKAKEYLKASKL